MKNKKGMSVNSVVPSPDEALRLPPVTVRGARTRKNLVDAARFVFERDGYFSSRLTDITAQAQCSIGTFYTYFETKEQIFAAVLASVKEDMMHPGMERVGSADTPSEVIEASNRAYFESYERNAKLMDLLEQVASIDMKFREVRRQRSAQFIERNARSIDALQKQGLADPGLDSLVASRALSTMVSRLAYYTYVLKEEASIDELVEVSTRVWCNALGIHRREG